MNEKKSEFCACGCGRPPSKGRAYAWGHKAKSLSGGASIKRTDRSPANLLLLVEADDDLCNKVWEKLSIQDKVRALNALRD